MSTSWGRKMSLFVILNLCWGMLCFGQSSDRVRLSSVLWQRVRQIVPSGVSAVATRDRVGLQLGGERGVAGRTRLFRGSCCAGGHGAGTDR